jgi:SAM-dependent methyltransferase
MEESPAPATKPPRMTDASAIAEHYGSDNLLARLEELLGAGPVSPLSLASVDQFHVGGLASTVEVAEVARLKPGEKVLDVGSGLGGPSRIMAALGGVNVVGLDLTPAYCEVATRLSARCGLSDRVAYQSGDATAMPFVDGSFDVVYSQHVAMNIENRAALYAEVHRVLKPGGRVVFHDIVTLGSGAIAFPVPWARTPAHSHLVSGEHMRALLAAAGFEETSWRDKTESALAWLRAVTSGPPVPLGLGAVMGPEFRSMITNLASGVESGRLGLVIYGGRRA